MAAMPVPTLVAGPAPSHEKHACPCFRSATLSSSLSRLLQQHLHLLFGASAIVDKQRLVELASYSWAGGVDVGV